MPAKSAIPFSSGICGSDFSRSTSETISPLSRGVSSEKPGAFWGALSGDEDERRDVLTTARLAAANSAAPPEASER